MSRVPSHIAYQLKFMTIEYLQPLPTSLLHERYGLLTPEVPNMTYLVSHDFCSSGASLYDILSTSKFEVFESNPQHSQTLGTLAYIMLWQ